MDRNGVITIDELKHLVHTMYGTYKAAAGEKLDQETEDAFADQLFKKLDANNDNKVTLEEFMSITLKDKTVADALQGIISGHL